MTVKLHGQPFPLTEFQCDALEALDVHGILKPSKLGDELGLDHNLAVFNIIRPLIYNGLASEGVSHWRGPKGGQHQQVQYYATHDGREAALQIRFERRLRQARRAEELGYSPNVGDMRAFAGGNAEGF